MHDNVLILAESGPDFMRTVKLAALYADRVHVYCPTDADNLQSIATAAKQIHPSPERILKIMDEAAAKNDSIEADVVASPTFRQDLTEAIRELTGGLPLTHYLEACNGNRADLESFKREGIVVSIVDNAYPHLPKQGDPWPAFLIALQALAEGASKPQIEKLKAKARFLRDFTARGDSASALFDSILTFIAYGSPDKKEYAAAKRKLQIEGLRRSVAGGVYFLICSYYASQNQCVGVTSDSKTQECFEKFCDTLYAGRKDSNSYITRREQVRARIGRQVLEDQVPDVSRLPFDVILELRRKRKGELKFFRDSLSKLASEIDPDLQGAKLTAGVDHLIQTEIKPALNQLNASLRTVEDQRRRKLLSPESDLVTFAVSSLIGVQIGLPLYAGALAVAASKVVDYTYGSKTEKNAVLRSNPWSVLFYLNQIRRRG